MVSVFTGKWYQFLPTLKLPGKAEFAQDFAIHLLQNLKKAKDNFIVPGYIRLGIEHLCKNHGI